MAESNSTNSCGGVPHDLVGHDLTNRSSMFQRSELQLRAVFSLSLSRHPGIWLPVAPETASGGRGCTGVCTFNTAQKAQDCHIADCTSPSCNRRWRGLATRTSDITRSWMYGRMHVSGPLARMSCLELARQAAQQSLGGHASFLQCGNVAYT